MYTLNSEPLCSYPSDSDELLTISDQSPAYIPLNENSELIIINEKEYDRRKASIELEALLLPSEKSDLQDNAPSDFHSYACRLAGSIYDRRKI